MRATLLAALVSCGGSGDGPTAPVPALATIQVTLASGTIAAGASTPAGAAGFDQNGAAFTLSGIIWSSSAPAVATVSTSGQVTGLAAGQASIVATAGGRQGQATITITPAPATALAITTQPSSTAASGAAFAVQPAVQLRDAGGNNVPLSGVVIAAAVDAGAGVLGGTATAVTDASGQATFGNLSIAGVTGARTLRFTSGLLAPATSNVVNITSGPVSLLTVTTQPSATATSGAIFAVQPVIQLRDASGNPVALLGVSITAAVESGSGTIGGTMAATTDANGVAAFNDLFITGIIGDRTLRFSAGALTPATSNVINITAGVATQLTITTQPSSTAVSGGAFAVQPAVQLRDASGNAVSQSGVIITAVVESGAGTLGGTLIATTDASGLATFSDLFVTGAAGDRTLNFTSGTLTPATSNVINIPAGTASQLTLTSQPSSTAVNGTPFAVQPVVQIRDSAGNAVAQSGVIITAAVESGAGTLGGTLTATTDASGVAAFNDLSISGIVGDRTLRFSAEALTPATSNVTNITAGDATQLTITTQPSATAVTGIPFAVQPVVQLRDASGNAVAQSGVSVVAGIVSGQGALGDSQTATTDVNGVASFGDLVITGFIGERTLRFTSSLLTPAVSNVINVTAGPAVRLTVTRQPSASGVSGVPLAVQPIVQLRDVSGNPVPLAGVTITAAIYSGAIPTANILGGTITATTDANGMAAFGSLSIIIPIDGAGRSASLIFSSTGTTDASSSSIFIGRVEPTQITVTTQPSATAASGALFAVQPVIQLVDAIGRPVGRGVFRDTITAAVETGEGQLFGTLTAVADSGGRAAFTNLSITGFVGDRTLRFTSGALTQASSSAISVTPGAATRLAITTQPSTTAQSGVAFPVQPVVQLRDAGGNAVSQSGVVITASFAVAGGTLGGTLTAMTDVNGAATFLDLSVTLSGMSGDRTLRFSAGTLTAATSTPITVNGTPSRLAFTSQPTNEVAGTAISPAVRVTVQDVFGYTVPNANDSVTLAIGINPAGGTLSGTTTVAAVNGVATFSDVTVNNTGTGYTLTATASGLTGATSSAFNIFVFSLTQVSAGFAHTCAVTVANVGYCWGSNNDYQLGVPLTTARSNPVAVSGGIALASVSAGANYSCGLAANGAAYCWGTNNDGQLGSAITQSLSPVAVSGGLTFASLSAGATHTCGVNSGGAAYCWGTNDRGQLGNGTTTNRNTPIPVSGGLTFASVSSGGAHTCGVTSGGNAYCWGLNSSGQLGNGSTTGSTTPVAVSGGLIFAAVRAAGPRTCGVTFDGAGYCWGSNPYGELGNGSTTNSSTPVAVSGGLTFLSVTPGAGSHTCGVTTTNAVFCWGRNPFGQLGNGSTNDTSAPSAVAGGLAFVAVSAGTWHTCGVTADGAAYCWGGNPYGALGNGSIADSSTPVRVSNPP